MSINSLSHYSLFLGLFIAFTYNKKEQPAFGAALSFWCILLSFLGLLFCHISNNFSNYNVLTANAPFFYQISGTWSNHEGSLFLWCWILSFYGFLLCYRGRPQSHNVSKRRGNRETLFCSFVSNFVKNSKLQELKSYENQSGTNMKPDGRLRAPAFALAQPVLAGGGEGRLGYVKLSNERSERVKRISALCALAKGERQDATYMLGSEKQSIAIERSRFFSAPFVLRTLAAASLLRSRRNRTFDGPALFYAQLYPGRKMSFAPMGTRRSRSSREGKRTNLFFDLARDSKERASYIDEELRQSAVGIALFFSLFLLASSDPFVRNFFVCTEPLAELNPVLQDPILAIHPPCISAGDVASAMGFGLCRSKMMNGIVALHSPPMRKDSAEKNGTLLCSAGCVGSRRTTELFTLKLKGVAASCYPAILLRSNRSLRPSIKMLRRRFLAFSSLGALMDTGREQANRVVHNGKKDTTPSPLCWTAGANTVVSDQDQEEIRIWILTCWLFLTVGILLGSWWAYHELGWGGWWFWDPVENASFMPWVLATACIHSVILPLHNSWTLLLNIGTFLCCVLGTFSIRSGLLASVHSFATDETRGIFLGRFFLLMTGISMILFSQMKLQASARRTYKKEMVGARSTLVHLRNSARAQPRPQQVPAELTRKPVRAGAHPVSCWSHFDFRNF